MEDTKNCMEDTKNVVASNLRARMIVHPTASSDYRRQFMKLPSIKTEVDNFSIENHNLGSNVQGSAKRSRSGKEVMLPPQSSIKVEKDAAAWGVNPVPVPVPVAVPVPVPTEMEAKRQKRLLANRESARKSRLRKQEYEEMLKRKVEFDQTMVNWMASQVAYERHMREALTIENTALKRRVAIVEIQNAAKDAERAVLLREINELRALGIRMGARK